MKKFVKKSGYLIVIVILLTTFSLIYFRYYTYNRIDRDSKTRKSLSNAEKEMARIDEILDDFKGLVYLSMWYEIREYDMEGGRYFADNCPIGEYVKVQVYSKKDKFYDEEKEGERVICGVTFNDNIQYFELIYLDSGIVSHCVRKWSAAQEKNIVSKLQKYNYLGSRNIIIKKELLGRNIFSEENEFIIEKHKKMINDYFIKDCIGKEGEYNIWLEDFLPGDVHTYFIVECIATGEKYMGIGKVSDEKDLDLVKVGLWNYKKCYYNKRRMSNITKKVKYSWTFFYDKQD